MANWIGPAIEYICSVRKEVLPWLRQLKRGQWRSLIMYVLYNTGIFQAWPTFSQGIIKEPDHSQSIDILGLFS